MGKANLSWYLFVLASALSASSSFFPPSLLLTDFANSRLLRGAFPFLPFPSCISILVARAFFHSFSVSLS